jgi:hypothetical protein
VTTVDNSQGELLSLPTDDVTTLEELLSAGGLVEDVTAKEEEYGIQVQGSDRKYPAVILRRKDRGKGATIRTISKNGEHAAEYDSWREVIEGYLARRAAKAGNGGRRRTGSPEHLRSQWVDQTVQNLEQGKNKGQTDRGGV